MRPVFFKKLPTRERLLASPRSGLTPRVDAFRFGPAALGLASRCFLRVVEPGIPASGLAAGKRLSEDSWGSGVNCGRGGNWLEIPKPLSLPFRLLSLALCTTWLCGDSDAALSANSAARLLTDSAAAAGFGCVWDGLMAGCDKGLSSGGSLCCCKLVSGASGFRFVSFNFESSGADEA